MDFGAGGAEQGEFEGGGALAATFSEEVVGECEAGCMQVVCAIAGVRACAVCPAGPGRGREFSDS